MKSIGYTPWTFPLAALSVLTMTALGSLPAAAEQAAVQVIGNPIVHQPIHSDVSPPMRELAALPSVSRSVHVIHAPKKPKMNHANRGARSEATFAVQSLLTGPLISATQQLGFAGVDQSSQSAAGMDALDCPTVSGFVYVPSDTNGAVGDTQFVQWVNLCYAVFDKFSGGLLAGPFAGTTFWKGFGAPCETDNDGDPIIQWDKVHHRWLAAQNVFFANNGFAPYYTCVAVSTTTDAIGSYYRYVFPQPGFPDYPKWGKKGDVYYQTQNNFGNNDGFVGVTVCAYQANLMFKGNPHAQQVCIVDDSNGTLFDDSMLPADDDSAGPSSPEVLLGAIDNFIPGDTHVYEFVFNVDFGHPRNSTLAGVNGSMPISVPAFVLAACPWPVTTYCVPQPGRGSELLDTLGDRLMYRLAHFSGSNGRQHYLVTHSVNDAAGGVGQRWYEFRAKGLGNSKLFLYQTGQTPADGEFRWMGSIGMDKNGDIALGYSRSSASTGDYPSLYYAGQTAGDPPGTTESEALIQPGGGSQLQSFDRWGDYSSMALDGGDLCTFWYTNEYYPVGGSFAWFTWIASLKFPNCH